MITGIVNSYLEATIELPLYDVRGQQQVILTIIDTGFDEALTLPASLIQSLGLPFRGSGTTLLADGSESQYNIHEAVVNWDGQFQQILVNSAETEPLLGMALLEDYELRVQVRPGGRVRITALPDALGEEPEPAIA